MKLALVIPTLNAETRGVWQQVLASVATQAIPLQRKIVIDSSSDDATCAMAHSFGWECRSIQRKEFNHGKTRDAIVQELAQDGLDTVVFLSQDVILSAPDALQRLTDFLWSHPIAGCFGKQQAKTEHSLNAWQRQRCYPEHSEIKKLQDVPAHGLMSIFFSNAFSAWKTAEVVRYGGFSETDFGEDTLLSARILNQGGSVGYCAEALAFHDHPNTPAALFQRGVQVGSFHRHHPELLKQFGKRTCHGPIPWTIWLPLSIKLLGYICGRMGLRFQHK